MTYAEKLKDPRWQKKRLEILNRDNFTCQICGDKNTELHIHHMKYEGKNPWNTKNESLKAICKHCHLITEHIKKYTTEKEPDIIIKKLIDGIACMMVVWRNNMVALYQIENNVLSYVVGISAPTFKEISQELITNG